MKVNKILFRELNPKEEQEFRQYAKDNDPSDMTKWHLYHPVCREEWEKRGIKPHDIESFSSFQKPAEKDEEMDDSMGSTFARVVEFNRWMYSERVVAYAPAPVTTPVPTPKLAFADYKDMTVQQFAKFMTEPTLAQIEEYWDFHEAFIAPSPHRVVH
jgi:hypothetical protein